MKGSVKLSAVKVRKQYRIQRYSIPIPRDPKSGALTGSRIMEGLEEGLQQISSQ